MIDIRIACECFGDTLLIEKLIERNVHHIKGKGNLKKYFERKEVQDSIIIGITDYDKDAPLVFNELGFKPIAEKQYEFLQANKIEGKKHYLVYIKPALEKFLMTCSSQLTDFEAPQFVKDLEQLKKKTKRLNVVKDVELVELISNLKRNKPEAMAILIAWINEFLNPFV